MVRVKITFKYQLLTTLYQKTITVNNPNGIHLKPASEIVQLSLSHPSLKIKLIKGEEVADGKSVMSILSLELMPQVTITLEMREENKEVLEKIEAIFS